MRILAALAICLAACSAAWADQPRSYVLALSWQPAFCAGSDGKRAVECKGGAPPQLALHGLWPQSGEYCSPDAQDLRRTRWRDLPAVRLPPGLRRELEAAMPGTRSHLDRYQWAKHGTCSGLEQEEFFRAAVDLYRQSEVTGFAALIRDNAKGVLRVADLCTALGRDLGPGADRAVRIVQGRDGKGGFLLEEIRIALRQGPDGSMLLAPERLATLDRGDGYRCSAARPDWRVKLAP